MVPGGKEFKTFEYVFKLNTTGFFKSQHHFLLLSFTEIKATLKTPYKIILLSLFFFFGSRVWLGSKHLLLFAGFETAIKPKNQLFAPFCLVGELSPRWLADPMGAEAASPTQLPGAATHLLHRSQDLLQM